MTSASFRFVCQGGGIDFRSAFLAASLRHHVGFPCEIVACIPVADAVAAPDPSVIHFLKAICDRIVSIRNPLPEDYLIGHKLAALKVETDQDYRVFLDSDMLCLRKMIGPPAPPSFLLAGKLEDWNHHSRDEWEALHRHFGLGSPRMDYRSTVFNEPMPMYLNAGCLWMDNLSDLDQRWIQAAWEIENHLSLPRQRPNLDQLALAALILRDQLSVRLLSETWNFPAELRPLDPARIPLLCHYHDPIHVVAEPPVAETISRLTRAFPDLATLAESSGDWFWIAPARTNPSPLYP